jgi:hypothetical protein
VQGAPTGPPNIIFGKLLYFEQGHERIVAAEWVDTGPVSLQPSFRWP